MTLWRDCKETGRLPGTSSWLRHVLQHHSLHEQGHWTAWVVTVILAAPTRQGGVGDSDSEILKNRLGVGVQPNY